MSPVLNYMQAFRGDLGTLEKWLLYIGNFTLDAIFSNHIFI